MHFRFLAPMAFVVVGCGARAVSVPPPVASPAHVASVTEIAPIAATVATPSPERELGRFRMTYYLVAFEREHTGPRRTELLGVDCRPLARVSRDFARELALEGTGRLTDGRLLNWAGRCDATKSRPRSPRYLVLDESRPWGIGVRDLPLVPFRSIATDPGVIPTGTRVYVRELDGIAMPGEAPWGGFVHDGCVEAVDVGEGIRGRHIDFFSGTRDAYHSLDGALGLRHVTVVDGAARCTIAAAP